MTGELKELREIDRDIVALKIGTAQLAVTANNLATQFTAVQVSVSDLTVKMAQMSHLTRQIEDLQTNVQSLNAMLERARGAMWVMTGAVALVGAGVGMVVNAIFRVVGKD